MTVPWLARGPGSDERCLHGDSTVQDGLMEGGERGDDYAQHGRRSGIANGQSGTPKNCHFSPVIIARLRDAMMSIGSFYFWKLSGTEDLFQKRQ